ncbi:MAG: radical SAM protein [Candidatus Omnitrophota bacterium]
MANTGICNKCKKIVPVEHFQRGGKEYLRKLCPDCGVGESLVSNDSVQYHKKRDFMAGREYPGCKMNCQHCNHRDPDLLFIETTNRCNMNCPICITNVPSMKFQFEPNMEYFDKIFRHYASFERRPHIQLFGGEPTMREDLFEIIELAQSYGFKVRLVTNGLRIADKAYAQKVIDSGIVVQVAFDGLRREMYAKLRNNEASLDLKIKALENLSGQKKRKVILMTVLDKQFNENDMPKFLEFCSKNQQIRGIFLMPLTQVWSQDVLEYKPERTTQEDVEHMLERAVYGKVEFVPLGSWEFNNLEKVFDQILWPFTGVHPNCESFTYLIPQEGRYVCLSYYLKYGFFSLVTDLRTLDKRLEPYASKPFGRYRKRWVYMQITKIFFKHWDFDALIGAKGLRAFGRWTRFLFKLAIGKKLKDVLHQESTIKNYKGTLQILLLPFEDDDIVESDRLEKCTSCFAYIDVKTDKVKSIPFCIWEKFKHPIMLEMARKYNKQGYTQGLGQGEAQAQVRGTSNRVI